jgi:rod shape-determining protein MreD
MRAWGWCLLAATLLWQLVALPVYALGSWGTVAPNFVLLVLLYLALQDRSHRVVIAALLIGAVTETLSLDPWGAHTLGYFFAVWLLRASLVESWADRRLPRLVLVAIGVTTAVSVRLCVLWLAAPDLETPAVGRWAVELVYNLAASWPLFTLLDAFRERLVRAPHRQLVDS